MCVCLFVCVCVCVCVLQLESRLAEMHSQGHQVEELRKELEEARHSQASLQDKQQSSAELIRSLQDVSRARQTHPLFMNSCYNIDAYIPVRSTLVVGASVNIHVKSSVNIHGKTCAPFTGLFNKILFFIFCTLSFWTLTYNVGALVRVCNDISTIFKTFPFQCHMGGGGGGGGGPVSNSHCLPPTLDGA